MRAFSATSAFGAGFKLIGRAPLAPLVWGLVVGLAFLPVQLAQMTLFWPGVMQSYGAALHASQLHQAMPPPPMQPPAMMMLSLLSLPLGLLVWSVVAAAGFRAVITPDQGRFFFLRLGRRELWLALVTAVQVVLFYVTLFAAAIVMALGFAIGTLGGAATRSAPGVVAGVIIGLVLGVSAGLAVLWLLMRFSLAGPMTVHDGEFRLFESWKLTKGHGWRLVGLALLVMFATMIFELLFFGAAAAIAAAFGLGNLRRLQELLSSPQDWMGQALPMVGVGLFAFTVIGGYFWTLMIAPWADAYRQIAAPRELVEVF